MLKYKLIFLLFVVNYCHGQNAIDIIEGLKGDLKGNIDNGRRATIFADIGYYYATVSIDSAVYCSEMALLELENVSDSVIISQVYSDAGAVYFRKGDF